jgi:hypothetical protein
MSVIQPTELHIHGLAPSRITSEVILRLSKNSSKLTFYFKFFIIHQIKVYQYSYIALTNLNYYYADMTETRGISPSTITGEILMNSKVVDDK